MKDLIADILTISIAGAVFVNWYLSNPPLPPMPKPPSACIWLDFDGNVVNSVPTAPGVYHLMAMNCSF